MNRFFLSLGSNIDPQKHLPACLEILKSKFSVKKVSSIYETKPVGPAKGNNFWNAVVEIETPLSAAQLLKDVRIVEASLGRIRNPKDKYAPRTIDIDILPQADYQRQAFIIIPLAEIAPHDIDPESGRSFSALAKSIPQEDQIEYRKIIF